MEIKLNLILSVIVEAVKAETFIKGTVDRAAGNDQHPSNGVSYHETAGDEEVHERKIMRCVYTSADKLRSFIQDNLIVDGANVADNNVLTIDSDNDSVQFVLEVSPRFNKANSDSLARLFSKYIEDNCLVLWWGTINQQQMGFYQNLLQEDITAILRLFIKTAPKAPVVRYTQHLELATEHGEVAMVRGERDTITYRIDEGVVDDIDAVSSDPHICEARLTHEGVELHARHSGFCEVKVFSRHNDLVSTRLNVKVFENLH